MQSPLRAWWVSRCPWRSYSTSMLRSRRFMVHMTLSTLPMGSTTMVSALTTVDCISVETCAADYRGANHWNYCGTLELLRPPPFGERLSASASSSSQSRWIEFCFGQRGSEACPEQRSEILRETWSRAQGSKVPSMGRMTPGYMRVVWCQALFGAACEGCGLDSSRAWCVFS